MAMRWRARCVNIALTLETSPPSWCAAFERSMHVLLRDLLAALFGRHHRRAVPFTTLVMSAWDKPEDERQRLQIESRFGLHTRQMANAPLVHAGQCHPCHQVEPAGPT